MGKKSILKTEVISKVWLNKKDYKFLDFDFKYETVKGQYFGERNLIKVYDFGVLILTLEVDEWDAKTLNKSKQEFGDKRFNFEVEYFNPQTDNDCFSINHIIATTSNFIRADLEHKDKGNAEVVNNQFIFRKKDNFYTYVKVWTRGDIKDNNYDKFLSYEFATNEYLSYVKKVFGIKKMPKRNIKAKLQSFLNKIILKNSL